MINLYDLNEGESMTIKKLVGRDASISRLSELGFLIGKEITMVKKTKRTILCELGDSRYAIEKRAALGVLGVICDET